MVMDNKAFEKEAGYSMEIVESLRKDFLAARKPLENVWTMLEAIESGEFWDTIRKKIPKHQVIPDTNYISYVKENYINSLYSAPYIADVLALNPDDMEDSRRINQFIEYEYNHSELGTKQLKISERTALLNVGFLQLGWDANLDRTRLGFSTKGGIVYTPRDTFAVVTDPNFDDLQDGRALYINTEDSIVSIQKVYGLEDEHPILGKTKEKDKNELIIAPTSPDDVGKGYAPSKVQRSSKGMLPVYIAYYKVEDRIDQIIYCNVDTVLEYKKGIKPEYYPVIPLYLNTPTKNAYGVGTCYKVLRNAIAVNILDSIAVTHTYASQRTPVVFDTRSGISLRRILTDMNNPDVVFPISEGAVDKVLHRIEYPALPENLEYIKSSLINGIKEISGIDDKYTGRDTASINTTGGMERMQQRVSMTDNTHIAYIEKYARDLTRMMMDLYCQYGKTQKFRPMGNVLQDGQEEIELNFSTLKRENFTYSINASPLLPKTRARQAENANLIMQIQMQYQQGGQDVQLITPEEWLFFQDFVQKDMILDRMKLERLRNDEQEIASELTSFGNMTGQGMRPEQAVQQLASERAMRREPQTRKNILTKQGS